MSLVDFITPIHKKTQRDYVARVMDGNKAEFASIAKRFDREYWDGDRKHGYGGFCYDGRWRPVAEAMAKYYDLRPGQKVLDVGCGKGFLLYELTQAVPGLQVAGIDISQYAIDSSKEEVRPFLIQGLASNLPFEAHSFDFVFSINTLHNLYIYDLKSAVQQMERVTRGKSYICVESYRNEQEKVNLLYWQLTCEAFFAVKEWEWLYHEWGYKGDYSFIFFE